MCALLTLFLPSVLMLNKSIVKVFSIYVFAFSFLFASKPANDADIWFHLKTGQEIIQTGLIPRTEIYSSTNYGIPFVAHGWLSGLLFYVVYSSIGLRTLTFLTALLAALAFWIVFRRTRSHPFIAGLATLLAVWAAVPTLGVKPRVFTLLFASVYLALLDNFAREGKGRRIWWLIPLMVVWVNLHGGFFIGSALIAVTLIGVPLDAWAAGENVRTVWPRVKTLALVFVGCLLAGLVNPYGVKMYTVSLQVLTSPVFQETVVDWLSPDFHRREFLPLLLLISLTSAALALSPKRVRPRELLLLLLMLYSTLKTNRQVAIFALVAAPLLAEHLYNWLVSTSFGRSFKQLPSSYSSKTTKLAYLLLLPLLAFGFRLKSTVYGPPNQQRLLLPINAVQYLREREIKGNTFTDPNVWGAYILWALPSNPVYIDGRGVYPEEFVREYVDIISGKIDWRPPFDRYGVKLVMIKPNSYLARELGMESGWQRLYEDEMAVVFERR